MGYIHMQNQNLLQELREFNSLSGKPQPLIAALLLSLMGENAGFYTDVVGTAQPCLTDSGASTLSSQQENLGKSVRVRARHGGIGSRAFW